MGFGAGDGAAGTPRGPEGERDLEVLGQRLRGVEPAALQGERTQLRSLRPTHQARTLDVAVGFALAHAHQNLSVLKHLDSPAAHRLFLRAKGPKGSGYRR